jgi:hypothetical protein
LEYKENDVGYTLSNKGGLHNEEKHKYAISIDRIRINAEARDQNEVFNFSSLEDKYKINKGGIYNINNIFFLKLRKKSEGNYRYTLDLSFDGKKIGKLSLDNYSNQYNHLVKLEFLNDVHYSIGKGWYWYFEKICKALSLKLHNISYLEIALDLPDVFDRFEYLHLNSTMCKRKLYKHNGRIKLNVLCNYREYIVGMKSTGKWIAIYNKTKEIEANDKIYITEFHKLKGLDTNKQIDRIELRMDNRWLKKYNITIEMLVNEEGLCSIFKEYTKDSLSFSDLAAKQYDKHRNVKYERIDLLDYSIFDSKPLDKPERKQKVTVGKSNRSTTNAFKHHLYTYLAEGRKDDVENLRDFISRETNWIIGYHAYSSHFGVLEELEQLNLSEYRKLLKRYIREYEGAIDVHVLWRMNNAEAELLFGTDNSKSSLSKDAG